MDNPQIIDDNMGGFALNTEIKAYLSETARWAKFLSIVGFVMMGFAVLIAFSIGSVLTYLGLGRELGGPSPFIFTFFMLLGLLLYVFPVLYTYRFATKMQTALQEDNEADLTASFSNLKSYYKFVGILTIISLGFYALGFIMILLTGGALSAM